MNSMVLDARIYQRDNNVSDMLFKHFVKMTEDQQRAIDFASDSNPTPPKPKRTMSDEELRAKVSRTVAPPEKSASQRLQDLRASMGRTDNNTREKEASGGARGFSMPDFNTSNMTMFDAPNESR